MGRITDFRVTEGTTLVEFAEELLRDGCSVKMVKEATGLSYEEVNEALNKFYNSYFSKEHDNKDKILVTRFLIKKGKLNAEEIADLTDMPVGDVILMKDKFDNMTQEDKEMMVLEREVDEIEKYM